MNAFGEVIYYDDDSAGSYNSKINFIAEAGETYYIIAKAYNSSIVNEYNLVIY